MRAQKKLSPSISSILFLIESPIAAISGIIFLNETLDIYQWLGGFLILAAALGVTLGHFKTKSE
jgi:drug/metabolite transporter (DMT)-like permease